MAYEVLVYLTPDSPNPSAGITNICFFYVKNLSDNFLIVDEFRIWVESNEAIDIYVNQIGKPVGGATSSPINMNLGSGNVALGTFLTGTNITGMSGGILIDRARVPADNSDHIIDWPSKLIIPKNKVLTLITTTGGIPLEISMAFYYHE